MSNDRAPSLRKSAIETDRAVSENMRDIDDYMRGTVQWIRLEQFDSLYTEPMYISLKQEPVGLVCVRVRQVRALEAPLQAGGVVPFVWDGPGSRAAVSLVPGLTTGTGQKYRFDFVAVG